MQIVPGNDVAVCSFKRPGSTERNIELEGYDNFNAITDDVKDSSNAPPPVPEKVGQVARNKMHFRVAR